MCLQAHRSRANEPSLRSTLFPTASIDLQTKTHSKGEAKRKAFRREAHRAPWCVLSASYPHASSLVYIYIYIYIYIHILQKILLRVFGGFGCFASNLRLCSALSALDVTCARWLIFFEGPGSSRACFSARLGAPELVLGASGPPFSTVSDGTLNS